MRSLFNLKTRQSTPENHNRIEHQRQLTSWPIGVGSPGAWILLFFSGVCFSTLPDTATAAIYKCTSSSGKISYNDKPCQNQQQETVKLRSHPKVAPSKPPALSPSSPLSEPPEALKKALAANSKDQIPEGKKSSANSPLAKAYKKFLTSLVRCKKSDVLRYVTSTTAKEMETMPTREFATQCRLFKSFSRTDFHNAREVIEGNIAKLIWTVNETRKDGDATVRITTSETIHLIKEKGGWVFGK